MPNLKKLALTYNIQFEKIEDASELNNKLSKYMHFKYPVLIDVRLVKNETLIPKVSALPQKDGSILSMPLEDMSPLLPLEMLKNEMIVDLLDVSKNIERR